jgi:hypothetical protein
MARGPWQQRFPHFATVVRLLHGHHGPAEAPMAHLVRTLLHGKGHVGKAPMNATGTLGRLYGPYGGRTRRSHAPSK